MFVGTLVALVKNNSEVVQQSEIIINGSCDAIQQLNISTQVDDYIAEIRDALNNIKKLAIQLQTTADSLT